MPKVSDAHRAARRRQILDAARRCFSRNGFHSTSMQDVFHEAELSAGAVYRYFSGKDAIIVAIAEEAVSAVLAEIDEIIRVDPVPPLEETMQRVLGVIDANTGPEGAARLAVQVWGESIRDPALADLVGGIYRGVRSRFVDMARRAQAGGRVPADADPEDLGALLFGLLPGYILQRLLVGDVEPGSYRAALHALLGAAPGEPRRARVAGV
ncbi:MAG TPA: TetR/AcrR family transcriptional regulator [Actinomycetes bacterium]|nr:TetR/AcrR family transcriptional regulator [Actinomycetes bacterium]